MDPEQASVQREAEKETPEDLKQAFRVFDKVVQAYSIHFKRGTLNVVVLIPPFKIHWPTSPLPIRSGP